MRLPALRKPMVELERLRGLLPKEARTLLGDGNHGGLYQRPDTEMLDIWTGAVEETREILQEGWA